MITKYCTKCKKTKPVSKFAKNKSAKDKLNVWCKSCMKEWSKQYVKTGRSKKVNKAWINKQKKLQGKNFRKKYRIKHLYGLTLEQHKEMYIQQNGSCAICEQPISYDKIFTDHSHRSGQVRKLLCHRCNVFVGYVETSPELLDSILSYLENHKEKK